MLRPDIATLRAAYERGENITVLLRETCGGGGNTVDAIELAYDLQAGSYTRYAVDDPQALRRRAEEMGNLLAPHLDVGDTILDCGTGELTTLSALSHHLPAETQLLAFYISLSRIRAGRRFAERMMRGDIAQTCLSFVADMHRIPLPLSSVDVVITSHALEPNHGREKELLEELFRVAKRAVILFEPSWENNTDQGKVRMERLGYVRGLPGHISAVGGKLVSTAMLSLSDNPLNPTCCYVIDPHPTGAKHPVHPEYCCPISGAALTRRDGYWWSENGGWAYPEIEGVPCLRERYAVLMTHG